MKKLIALLLAAIMVLSLAACASSPAADQPANDQTTADTTTEETKTEEKTEEKTEDTAASGDVEVVTYYCSIGAYLSTLQAEVANWNETTARCRLRSPTGTRPPVRKRALRSRSSRTSTTTPTTPAR